MLESDEKLSIEEIDERLIYLRKLKEMIMKNTTLFKYYIIVSKRKDGTVRTIGYNYQCEKGKIMIMQFDEFNCPMYCDLFYDKLCDIAELYQQNNQPESESTDVVEAPQYVAKMIIKIKQMRKQLTVEDENEEV